MPLSKIKTNSVADEVFDAGRSLIINGDFAVAQRASSSTTLSGYLTVDRFETYFASSLTVPIATMILYSSVNIGILIVFISKMVI